MLLSRSKGTGLDPQAKRANSSNKQTQFAANSARRFNLSLSFTKSGRSQRRSRKNFMTLDFLSSTPKVQDPSLCGRANARKKSKNFFSIFRTDLPKKARTRPEARQARPALGAGRPGPA